MTRSTVNERLYGRGRGNCACRTSVLSSNQRNPSRAKQSHELVIKGPLLSVALNSRRSTEDSGSVRLPAHDWENESRHVRSCPNGRVADTSITVTCESAVEVIRGPHDRTLTSSSTFLSWKRNWDANAS